MKRTWACGLVLAPIAAALTWIGGPPAADSACCYFSAKDKDILQPAQKVFISWDPAEKVESFTVQPKFEGNALDFGMVIPTPSKPKLDEMPRDFFKELAVYTILKKREQPQSKLMPQYGGFGGGRGGLLMLNGAALAKDKQSNRPQEPSVRVLEAGVVGSLDYRGGHQGLARRDWLQREGARSG